MEKASLWEIFRFDCSCRVTSTRTTPGCSEAALCTAAGIRYGNFQFGQNLRIYPTHARAAGTGCGICIMRGVEGAQPPPRRRGERTKTARRRRKAREGRRERKMRPRTKGEYVCDVCGGHYEEPGVVARQRLSQPPHTHTTLNQSPKPPCEISLHLMAYSFFRSMSFFPSCSVFLVFIQCDV